VPDTWEARQPAAFQALLRAIDICLSRAALTVVGRQLYAAWLPRAQAGVAWTRYRIRQAALDAAALLGPDAPGLTPAEWRRLWAAYRARRPARSA
jgi:hypothetical protein